MAREAVIGLECHIQLATRTKMFCGCPVVFGAEPNSAVCPVCMGLPGALPRVNARAVEAAVVLGLALGCRVRSESVFARKNYFYPDMPKNYQVTQYDRPVCEGGELGCEVEGGMRTFALTRIHLEEDAGKSFHPERHGDRRLSRVDFNRAGVPLLELVTEPVFHSPAECAAFLAQLRRLVRWLGISGGDMEKGQLRCDANVSVREVGVSTLGTKRELKNLNTIKGVERGVAREIETQCALLDAGERIVQATMLYDADRDRLEVMRTKEQAHDYRYFPDPDLPVLRLRADALERARAESPELPWTREARYRDALGLPAYDAQVLTEDRA
ncbi:MAG: Asp-tRNA(Asn)/Glu-tRNA(Gln) amidotransferase subunit GatB, partial [bacterium]